MRQNTALCGNGLSLLQTTNFHTGSKSQGFADDTLILARIVRFVFDMLENIVGNGENANIQHFLLFTTMFSNGVCHRGVKTRAVL